MVRAGPDAAPPPLGPPTRGPADAAVTIVALMDFEDPFCALSAPALDKVTSTWPEQVRLVFRHKPLAFHARAIPAAVAAMAAHRQGRFWPYTRLLWAHQDALSDADLEKYAAKAGLDLRAWHLDRADPSLRAHVLRDRDAAFALGIPNTPTFFVNGLPIRGVGDLDSFRIAVEHELASPAAHETRARLHLGAKFHSYWTGLILGAEPTRPARPLDPTVWRATLAPAEKATEAPVTLIRFGGRDCRYTAQSTPIVEALKADWGDRLRVVHRDLEADRPLAEPLGVVGTPTFFVNGRKIVGVAPYHELDEAIRRGLKDKTPYDALVARGKRVSLLDETVHDITLEGRPTLGPPTAAHTIAFFADFECPHSRRLWPSLKAMVETPGANVRLVFKHFPLRVHPHAERAAVHTARAGLTSPATAAGFWPVVETMFEAPETAPAVEATTRDPAVALVQRDLAEARAAGLKGTPGILIDGRRLRPVGAHSRKRIEAALRLAP